MSGERRSRWRRRLRSVRFRVSLAATLAVAISLVAAGLVMVVVLRVTLERSFTSDARLQAELFATQHPTLPLPNPLPAVVADRFTGLQILDAHGHVLTASQPLTGLQPLVHPGGDARRAPSLIEHTLDGQEGPWQVNAVPATIGGQPVTVVVVSSLRQYRTTVQVLSTLLFISLPVLLGLFVVGLWLVVGRALRPVESMRREVGDITSTQLSHRVPVPDTGDEIARLGATLNDMLNRLERSATRQTRFVADASHELRSPIANIRTALEVALANPAPPDWPTIARDALDQDARLQGLVDDLITLARSDEHELQLHAQPVELASLVRDEATRSQSGSITVAVETTSNPIVLADRNQLRRIIDNLLDNARRYASSHVEVIVASHDHHATISVQDDGPGIAAPDRERVFERFVRLDEGRARSTGGFGLGLAIVKELVTAHGGTTRVTDADHHHGAKFEVTLPIAQPPPPS